MSKSGTGSALSGECALYLVTPIVSDAAAFAPLLAGAIDTFHPEAVQLRLAPAPESPLISTINLLKQIVQSRDVALLLRDLPALARRSGCDGVHMSVAAIEAGPSVAEIRKLIGDELQLGVSCGVSRDLAMCAGEEGADYIAFCPGEAVIEGLNGGPDEIIGQADLLRWWSMMMELPVVAETDGLDQAGCEALATSGADFLAIGGDDEAFWQAIRQTA